MATGKGNLPNPTMAFTPFDILLAAELNDLIENIEALAAGTGIGDGSVGTSDIANSAVTSQKIDFTSMDWQSYTPTIGGFATPPTGTIHKYIKRGRLVHLVVRHPNAATSNSSVVTITLPVPAATDTNLIWANMGQGTNNGASVLILGNIQASAPTLLQFGVGGENNGFATSGPKRINNFEIFYESAT